MCSWCFEFQVTEPCSFKYWVRFNEVWALLVLGAVWCSVYTAVQCQYTAVQCSEVQQVQCSALQCSGVQQCSAVQTSVYSALQSWVSAACLAAMAWRSLWREERMLITRSYHSHNVHCKLYTVLHAPVTPIIYTVNYIQWYTLLSHPYVHYKLYTVLNAPITPIMYTLNCILWYTLTSLQ